MDYYNFGLAVVQLVIAALSFFVAVKTQTFEKCAFCSAAIGFISLIIGELGRKRSRSNFLKLYVFGSSIAVLLPATCFSMSQNHLEVLQTFNSSLPSNIEVLKIAAIILGFLVQIFSVATTVSLIRNMALPKKAS